MRDRTIYLSLVMTAFFWGANFNLGAWVVQTLDPLSAAAWRFLLAGVVMAVYVLFREKVDWSGMRRHAWPLLAMAFVGVFGFNVTFFYGLQSTSAVNGALIMTLNPTLTVVLTALVMGDTISWRQILGLGLSLLGVVVVVTRGSWSTLAQHLHFGSGDALILLGNLCWALYSVIGKRWVSGLTPAQTTAGTMLMGAVLMVTAALSANGGALGLPSAGTAWALVAMALFGTVLAYLWWNQGVRRIGPAHTAVFFDLVPVSAMLIAIMLGESVSLGQWLGAAMVISGVMFSSGALDRVLRPAPQCPVI
ncbi:DMT family transporter [Castellaniella sp.]|uniref:DMT family transporter n=1 Tax=Castellaniella sp. TaxID=1955812 RepID=UPI002AFDDD78|nr:EamA family transporter [Castellaniella sp.]